MIFFQVPGQKSVGSVEWLDSKGLDPSNNIVQLWQGLSKELLRLNNNHLVI